MAKSTNGAKANGAARFDPLFTQRVIEAMGPKTDPRMRQIMSSLIRHVHDFARETELTVDEWMAGVQMINWAGQMSDERRNEGQLLCDTIGLESLVDEITYRRAAEATDIRTQSAILGPFFRLDTPLRKNGDTISFDTPSDGQVVYMHGRILDAKTKEPLLKAELRVWEASTNGLYSQQDPAQVDHNLHGRFESDAAGSYAFYCLKPTPYPIPDDGPSGKLLKLMDRHPYRPAHIHLMVLAKGYQPVTTQIFDEASEYLDNDTVFAVKDALVFRAVPRQGDPKAKLELEYDIYVMPID